MMVHGPPASPKPFSEGLQGQSYFPDKTKMLLAFCCVDILTDGAKAKVGGGGQ